MAEMDATTPSICDPMTQSHGSFTPRCHFVTLREDTAACSRKDHRGAKALQAAEK